MDPLKVKVKTLKHPKGSLGNMGPGISLALLSLHFLVPGMGQTRGAF